MKSCGLSSSISVVSSSDLSLMVMLLLRDSKSCNLLCRWVRFISNLMGTCRIVVIERVRIISNSNSSISNAITSNCRWFLHNSLLGFSVNARKLSRIVVTSTIVDYVISTCAILASEGILNWYLLIDLLGQQTVDRI